MFQLDHGPAVWIWFNLALAGLLALDLGVFHRREHRQSLREALLWSVFWISLGLAFALVLWIWASELGLRAFSSEGTLSEGRTAIDYLTAYLIEKTLSMDNLFVFLLLFQYFGIPDKYQYQVLFWGIIGALVMRLTFILVGTALLRNLEWVVYLFGAILLISGVQMWRKKGAEAEPEKNFIIRLLRKVVPITDKLEGNRFLVWHEGRRKATPLLATLIAIEMTDVLFAIDSVPAVLAVTEDQFIAYSSNAFAILGLRALYFALAGLMPLFEDLHYGLSIILIFVGTKMVLQGFVELPEWSHWVSLGFVVTTLTVSVITSIYRHRK